MPFEAIETITRPSKDVRASISYRRFRSKHDSTSSPRLTIGVPKHICDGVKAGVLKDGKMFALHVGNGNDAGKARIMAVAAGGAAVRMLRGGAVFRFGYVPMLGHDAAAKEFVDARPMKDGFEIDLPAWFKGD